MTDVRVMSSDSLPPAYTQDNSNQAVTLPDYKTHVSTYTKPLPSSFNVYFKRSSKQIMFYHIGQTKDTPFFTIATHLDWSERRPLAVLYNGAFDSESDLSPKSQVAAVTRDSVVNPHTEITLFSSDITEHLEHHISQKQFTFSFNITHEKHTTRQLFQWRLSRGSSLKSLDGLSVVWTLVRFKGLDRRRSPASLVAEEPEVVATRSENLNWTSNKVAKFQFVGAGARGQYGDDWAVMAMMSALRL